MPVVSPSRFTTSTSSGLTSGSYRSSLGTSTSLDRPYYRTSSTYITPTITRSNYGDRSSSSEYRSSRISVTSDSGLDGRRERKSSFTSEYSRSFSRAPSVGDSDSGISTTSRYAPRSERSESRSRDVSATRSDGTKTSNSDPLPRNSTGTLSRTRNPSTSSILSCSASDFYNKYSPTNYVPLSQRLNAVASANNSNTNGTDILRSKSISNDIGRPPAPFDSRSSRKNRTTVTNNEKQRAVETIGKHIRSASSSSGISPSKYKEISSSTYPQVNPKKNFSGRDRNGNDLHQSVAEIRKRFDPKMTVTKLPANDSLYVTNYVNQLKSVQNGSLNGSRTVQRDKKLVPVHLPSLSNGSHKWDTLSTRSDSNSDLSSRTNSDGTLKGRDEYDTSPVYVGGKYTEGVPLKYQFDRNSPIAKILEKSTVIHVDNNDTGYSSGSEGKKKSARDRSNVISIEVGSENESLKSMKNFNTIPSHTSNFASYIQISTPIASGCSSSGATSSATVVHSKAGNKNDLEVQEIPRYSPQKIESLVVSEKLIECNLSKISYIDQETEIVNNTHKVDAEINSPDYPNAGFENRTFEHENYLSNRNTVDEVDCAIPKCNKNLLSYENQNSLTNGEDIEKSSEKMIESTSSSEMNDDSSSEIPTVRRKVPDLFIPIGVEAETEDDLPPTSSTKRSSLGVAGGNSSALSARRNSDQPILTNGHSSSRASGLNGLRNIGNTCFMNSVIQCLSNTRPLLEFVTEDKYVAEINTSLSPMKGALIQAFATVIKELWQEGERDMVVNTTALKSQIQRFAPRFIGYSQQDAQEFLRYLLEGLHEDVNRVTIKPKPIHTEIDDNLSDSEKAAEAWHRYQRMEDSRVGDIFVGQLKSQLKCTHCSHTSVTFDPFWDLSLPIPSRTGQLKLQQCLAHFTKEEEMDGDEKPTCAKCGVRRKCLKWFTVQKFPRVLVLHLKRFSPTERFRGKLSVVVDFPLNGLDMSPYAANKGQQTTYNLCAVSNHSGTTYSGHYTAYCKHPYNQEWHEYNDSRVTPISPKNVVSSEAYVLFYELANSSNDRAASHL